MRRAGLPSGRAGDRDSSGADRRASPDDAAAPGRAVRGPSRRDGRLPPPHCLSGRSHAIEIDDPYRYGRVLTDFDLHLLSRARTIARSRSSARTGSRSGRRPACISPSGRRTPIASASSAISTAGTAACTPCGCSRRPASGRSSSPDLPDGERYKFEIRTKAGALLKKADPFGVAFEVPPQSASVVRDISGYKWQDEAWMQPGARAGRLARSADGDLRSAPRVVGARARKRATGSSPIASWRTGWCRT